MKTKTLSILAGVGVPLILIGAAEAGFVGIKTVGKPNPYKSFGLLVVNVYAVFDRPGEDRVEAIFGSEATPFRIEVMGGTFYNTESVGQDTPPTAFLVGLFPSLAYDTFLTVGVKVIDPTGKNGQPKDNLTLTPFVDWFDGSVTECTECGWGVTPLEAQGDPFDPVNSFPGNGHILIGQYSTIGGTAIAGSFLLQYTSNGVQFQQSAVSFFHVPGPGGLALLGTAGLMGGRRRRR